MESLTRFVPAAARTGLREADLGRVVDFLTHGRSPSVAAWPQVCVLTGAGISTESGIPDYRSPQGSYSRGHKPMTHQEFLGSGLRRGRYWARAVVASQHFKAARPNAGHEALARLERLGIVSGIVTQNVDRLHQRAGSGNVLELHGHTGGVKCTSCAREYSRDEFHGKVFRANEAWFAEHMPSEADLEVNADGDAQVTTDDLEHFCVPGCPACEGVLMPTIVFFGGNVDPAVKERSFDMVSQADKLLVVGSSLTVWSSFRLCRAAAREGKPIGIINTGDTRADDLCEFKVQTGSGPLLAAVSEALEEELAPR